MQSTEARPEKDLLDALETKQKTEGLSNLMFARKLNISDVFMGMLKSGQREPGKKFLGAVCVEYPDLQLHVVNYLVKSCSLTGVAV